jgi:hypothetical protein
MSIPTWGDFMNPDTPWTLPVRLDQEIPTINLASPGEGEGAVVALVAEEDPRRDGWCPGVAVGLAREWAADGRRVFLADGDLERPALHRILGEENGEGMSDAIVYGASPGRIGRPIVDGGFLFAPAGTVVPDLEAVYAHPRWNALLDAFRESGSVFLLYLPAGSGGGLDALVDRANRVVRLTAAPPETDPGTGALYIHPAEGTAPPAAAPEPGDLADDDEFRLGDAFRFDEPQTEPAPAAGGEDSDLVLGDELSTGDEWSGGEDDVLDAGVSLSITDEWAGDGPASVAEASRPDEVGRPEEGHGTEEPAATEGGEEQPAPTASEDVGGPRGTEGPVEPGPSLAAKSPSAILPERSEGVRPEPSSPAVAESDARRPPVRARPVERNLTPWLLLILAVILAAVLVASWLGYVTIPGLTFAPHPGDAGTTLLHLPDLPPIG